MSDTVWLVFCPAHQHYLIYAGVSGTSWTREQTEARRYTKGQARRAADSATWQDHNPTPWPVSA